MLLNMSYIANNGLKNSALCAIVVALQNKLS